jgi:hypothetical protein
MPISHAHKVIFIHIPKTAGTSVEAVLGMHGGKQDIGVVPYFNQCIDYEHLYGGPLQHLTAQGIRQVLKDDSVFNAYFKFTIVRNPWDRLVSAIAWSDQKWARGVHLSPVEFDQQVHMIHRMLQSGGNNGRGVDLPPYLYPQSLFVLGQDRTPMVDYVARYETLPSDWRAIGEKLGVDVELPTRMKSRHGNYRQYYTDRTRQIVGEMYAEDVRAFQYAF